MEIISIQKRVINAAIINENKELYIVQKGDTWILPGGKPQEDESDLECLIREVSEELSGTSIDSNIQHYRLFRGISPNTKTNIDVYVYFVKFDGEVRAPSREISNAIWTSKPKNYPLSETTLEIVNNLINDKYL